MENSRTFQVTVRGFDNQGVVVSLIVQVVATTKWHAVELAFAKYCRMQPNRNLYSAK
jgi:hypothetical protein